MLTGSFGGAGVHIRNSATLNDDTCYTPLGVCSVGAIQSFAITEETIEYSTSATTTLPTSSKFQSVLNYCPSLTCSAFESDCATASTSSRVTFSASSPQTVTINDANTLEEWRETKCIKCSINGVEVTFTEVVFIKGGICNWKKVRHLPQNSATWYSCTDRLAGTCVVGNPLDDSQEWAVKYDHETFDQFMFATNDLSRFTIMDKSKFLPHVETDGLKIANHRSSFTPDEPGTSQVFNRELNA